MTLASLRKKVQSHIERADEAQLLTILRIVERGNELPQLPYDDEFRDELARRVSDLKSGRTKAISAEESKARLNKMLNAAIGK